MPVHGDQPDITEQLASIADQTYDGWWELLIADNGCSPMTLGLIEPWRERIANLRIVAARERPGANYARNRAVDVAEGDLVAICDADDVVEPDWLTALSVVARDAELVGGHVDVAALNTPLVQAWRPSPTADGLPDGGGFLPYVVGCNCALWRDVYLAVGGCDEEVGGGGGGDDVDLSWRVQLAGGRIVFAPEAVVHYRLRPDLRSMSRQLMTYGVSSALTYRKYRAFGAPRRDGWITIKHWGRLVQRAPRMLVHPDTRGLWLGEVAFHLGRLRGGVRYRVLFW
jgi:glycosyltransferase involved in cell wall biosynthesis